MPATILGKQPRGNPEVFGLRLPASLLDQTALDDLAGTLVTEGVGILTSPTSFNQVLGTLIKSIDAFPVIDPTTAQIGLRFVRDGEVTVA